MTGRDLSDSMLILPLVRCKCDHVQWAGTSGRSRKTVVPVHKGASLSSILRSKVCCEYGGYLTPGSIRALWYRTPRALVNDSKLNLPLYLPIPELRVTRLACSHVTLAVGGSFMRKIVPRCNRAVTGPRLIGKSCEC